jgi:hypothetical protein
LLLRLASDAAHRLDAMLFVNHLVQNSSLTAPTVILVQLWLSIATIFGCTAPPRMSRYRTYVLVALAVAIMLSTLWGASLWLQQATDQGFAYLSGQLESTAFLQFTDLHLPRTMWAYIIFSIGFLVTGFAIWRHWLRPAGTWEARKCRNQEPTSLSAASPA